MHQDLNRQSNLHEVSEALSDLVDKDTQKLKVKDTVCFLIDNNQYRKEKPAFSQQLYFIKRIDGVKYRVAKSPTTPHERCPI